MFKDVNLSIIQINVLIGLLEYEISQEEDNGLKGTYRTILRKLKDTQEQEQK